MTRRRVIIGGTAIAALGGAYGLSQLDQTLPPRDAVAEQRFKRSQDNLLNQAGVQFSSQFLEIADPHIRTHVLEAGNGEPVLMIHGGYGMAAQWMPLLGALSADFHVYAPDRPGCGLTQMFNYRGVHFREHAVAFVRSTMDALQLKRAALIGNSMGGYFSLVFALAYPHRVSRLITIGEPAGSSATIPLSNRLLSTRGINGVLYATVMKPSPSSTRESFQRILVADVRRVPQAYLDCNTAASLIPGATQSWLTMLQNVVPGNGRSTLTYALRPELGGLEMPTLMIWGDKDTFGPPSLGAEMVKLMPHGKVVVLPNAGHLAWLDQPDKCAGLVRSFLLSL